MTEVDDTLEDDTTYVFGLQAVTNDGNNVVTSFSDAVSTLPADAVPGMCLIAFWEFDVTHFF